MSPKIPRWSNIRLEMAEVALNEARKIYTQKQLADLLQVVPRTISRWEKGEVLIPKTSNLAIKALLQKHGNSANHDFTFIDLFAGIGGIRLGFEEAGGKCVYTSEWDSYSQKTYKVNFPNDDHIITGDITKVLDPHLEIPDHDVLLAGFPCQPFSIAGVSKKNALGRPHGFECTTQGTLFFDVARIIDAKQPKAFLLENVKNLLSHDKGNTFAVIKDTLENQLGYIVQAKVIDGQRFVPQHRERIIIVGFKNGVGFSWDNIEFPPRDDGPKLGSILHKQDGTELDLDEGRFIDAKGKVHRKFTLSDKLWQYLQDYAAKHRAKGNGFGFGLFNANDIARTLSARYYKDGSEILIYQGSRKNPRRLTPRECARLMGYPDTYKIPVSDTRAYKQFGNSVVVPLVSHIAKAMKEHILCSLEDDRQVRLF